MSQFLLSGSSSLVANINSSLSSCSQFLSAHSPLLQITLLYLKDLTLSNPPFLSISSFLAFFPKKGRGWGDAERARGLELNTLRCTNPLGKRILDPRFTRDLQGHLVKCLNVLPREAVWARKNIGCWSHNNPGFNSALSLTDYNRGQNYIIFLSVS